MERKERRTIHSVPRGRRFHLDKRHSNRPVERARDEEERSYARNVRDAVHRRGINNRGGPGMSGNHGQSRARAPVFPHALFTIAYMSDAPSPGESRGRATRRPIISTPASTATGSLRRLANRAALSFLLLRRLVAVHFPVN